VGTPLPPHTFRRLEDGCNEVGTISSRVPSFHPTYDEFVGIRTVIEGFTGIDKTLGRIDRRGRRSPAAATDRRTGDSRRDDARRARLGRELGLAGRVIAGA
jgi:hypothetical protein